MFTSHEEEKLYSQSQRLNAFKRISVFEEVSFHFKGKNLLRSLMFY